MSDGRGIELDLDLLDGRISTLTELGDLTSDLVATACRLAERLPMLGTAPPAVHLAMRLREAAGSSGLAGEIEATVREVREYQEMLAEAKGKYQDHDTRSAEDLKAGAESESGSGGSNGSPGSNGSADKLSPAGRAS
ncbi:hypothetical protein [Amycolatopsis albispora]|uniref:ESX-1 secretion-associated protein n=1 Tax=Amycolatopsis albispora TaxID=1804986 RepID=A0A344KZX2_9PSEU|nr:hypothetical protein [Amycolatopsis albispora]AXB41346.1 hypothetical protein A4R43_01430 [Amycolatopsis albispora]